MNPFPKPRDPRDNSIMHPVSGAFTITPGLDPQPFEFRSLYVGVTGNVTVTHPDGTTVQYLNIAAGVYHPIGGTHVTEATAAGLVGAKM